MGNSKKDPTNTWLLESSSSKSLAVSSAETAASDAAAFSSLFLVIDVIGNEEMNSEWILNGNYYYITGFAGDFHCMSLL